MGVHDYAGRVLIAIVASVLAVAACGGDDGGESAVRLTVRGTSTDTLEAMDPLLSACESAGYAGDCMAQYREGNVRRVACADGAFSLSEGLRLTVRDGSGDVVAADVLGEGVFTWDVDVQRETLELFCEFDLQLHLRSAEFYEVEVADETVVLMADEIQSGEVTLTL